MRPSKGWSGVPLLLFFDSFCCLFGQGQISLLQRKQSELKVNCANLTFSADFGLLSAFWEKTVACFRSHVACPFYMYPLGGLLNCINYYLEDHLTVTYTTYRDTKMKPTKKSLHGSQKMITYSNFSPSYTGCICAVCFQMRLQLVVYF